MIKHNQVWLAAVHFILQFIVKIRSVKPMISDAIDLFGKNIQFYDETKTHISVRVKVNERSVLQFAKNYASDIVILSPKKFWDKMRVELEKGLQAYQGE